MYHGHSTIVKYQLLVFQSEHLFPIVLIFSELLLMKLLFLVSWMFLIALSIPFSFDTVYWDTIVAISISMQFV